MGAEYDPLKEMRSPTARQGVRKPDKHKNETKAASELFRSRFTSLMVYNIQDIIKQPFHPL